MDYDPDDVIAIFNPYANRRFKELDAKESNKLAHYTNVDGAISILKSQGIWMRNSQVMNDYSEVAHGMSCLDGAKNARFGQRLWTVLERIGAGLADEVRQTYAPKDIHRIEHTYITSFCEHDSAAEDQYGKLSMWRAYGIGSRRGESGVALVFNKRPFIAYSGIGALSSPVLYAGTDTYRSKYFSEFVRNLERHEPVLVTLGRDLVRENVINAMHFSVLSTKHPGFREEKEWRVIYSSTLSAASPLDYIDDPKNSGKIIHILPLKNLPLQHHYADIKDILHKVIIGPSANPTKSRDKIIRVLRDIGVPFPEFRVVVSNIPIRS
jgi:hypothetical protein